MREYSVKELIRINELFESSSSVRFIILNKFVQIEITDEEGIVYPYTVTKREFNQIKRNFYIEELNEIIECGLDEDLDMYTKINAEVSNFPVEVIFMDKNVPYRQFQCNFEELGFVYNSLRIQRGAC
ncbi:hypothetical protein [Cytobacillus massiliigabonensis]|uniref:hypothetical protein n=1 Tax=Cytobacillus massiliigabonensis TaxID=1871011 RepID=UPI000C8266A8|nr:hypothetical protein [Cytobacillus massiliigabonensis]